jgi:hypothetical protein
MKSYEPIQPDKVSIFWPKANDEGTSIEGVHEQIEPGQYREVLVLRTAIGIRKVSVTARVAAVLPKMKLGARYRFTYAGTTPLPSGQHVKEIRIDRVRDDTPDALGAENSREPGDEAEAPF